jgi:hypothetical protein
LSQFMDLLKQVPPKGEIPDILLKKGNIAACNLLMNKTVDAPEEEKRDDYGYEGQISERYAPVRSDSEPFEGKQRFDGPQEWSLLDRYPLQLGDIVILQAKDKIYWYLGISSCSNRYFVFERGSKEEIYKRAKELNEYREKEGEDAFEAEIMYLRDLYRGE